MARPSSVVRRAGKKGAPHSLFRPRRAQKKRNRKGNGTSRLSSRPSSRGISPPSLPCGRAKRPKEKGAALITAMLIEGSRSTAPLFNAGGRKKPEERRSWDFTGGKRLHLPLRVGWQEKRRSRLRSSSQLKKTSASSLYPRGGKKKKGRTPRFSRV